MESQFWEVLKTHPVLFIAAIIGAVFVISKFLQEGKKLVGILGFKTPREVTQHEHDLEEHEHDEQLGEIKQQIADMKQEMRDTFREIRESLEKLGKDIENVRDASVVSLGDRITQKCVHYLDVGSIPPGEIKEFYAMFDTYKVNFGNHGVDALFFKTLRALGLEIPKEYEGEIGNYEHI